MGGGPLMAPTPRLTAGPVPAVNMQPEVTMSVDGAGQAADDLIGHGEQVARKGAALTRHYGARLQAAVRVRARAAFQVTNYDDSIRLRIFTGKRGDLLAEVYTRDPQGHRLEFGFIGEDSLGRRYHQSPRPHFRPALAEIHKAYERAITKEATR